MPSPSPAFGSRIPNILATGFAERTQTPRFYSKGRMASTSTRNEEKKGSRMSQAAASLGGGPASMGVSLSRSEEFLTRCSSRPKAPTPVLTETAPAPRHTCCHPLVTRTYIRAPLSQVINTSLCWGLLVMSSITLEAS
ncbi:uncharacterized protein LOC115297936 isoform X5 [Suricata suricatta]|uniref:uncharacterized protein LOC115297936 isoform X5 n=1 Tax=Suricata suricatta TaxID=37032 RepID=UPI00115571F3|nr:uncharacterized protein LOC115297936 isoform X5 [Suricata suricatta]